jgi:hypothetical protein
LLELFINKNYLFVIIISLQFLVICNNYKVLKFSLIIIITNKHLGLRGATGSVFLTFVENMVQPLTLWKHPMPAYDLTIFLKTEEPSSTPTRPP